MSAPGTESCARTEAAGTAGPESGVALLLVLVVLLLTSILALEIKGTAALHWRLAQNQRDDFLVRQVMRGRLEVLKQVLLLDLQENDIEALDDRWAEERYSEISPDEDEEPDPEEPVSTESASLSVRIEDEARKFNLHNLVTQNEELRAHWEEVFVRLVRDYRKEYGRGTVSEGDAIELLENLKGWLARKDDPDGMPRPATEDESRVIITPDELLMVEGFTREILYDLAPEEEGEEPVPGLLRYLTVWSAGPVNLNTAEPAVIYALFEAQDEVAAENLLAWREEEAEEQPENLHPDAEPKRNAIRTPQDLLTIDGFTAEVLQRSRITPETVTAASLRFSVHLIGESAEGIRRQERWVLERNAEGFTTLLYEERNDPTFGEEEE
jgi:type II secretory pathway component PulK